MCIWPTEDAIQFGFYPTHWTGSQDKHTLLEIKTCFQWG